MPIGFRSIQQPNYNFPEPDPTLAITGQYIAQGLSKGFAARAAAEEKAAEMAFQEKLARQKIDAEAKLAKDKWSAEYLLSSAREASEFGRQKDLKAFEVDAALKKQQEADRAEMDRTIALIAGRAADAKTAADAIRAAAGIKAGTGTTPTERDLKARREAAIKFFNERMSTERARQQATIAGPLPAPTAEEISAMWKDSQAQAGLSEAERTSVIPQLPQQKSSDVDSPVGRWKRGKGNK